MLIRAERSCLLAIDLQERLMPAIHDSATVIANSAWLLSIARRLEVPVLASEQYPKGLGPIVAEIRNLLAPSEIVAKNCFACSEDPALAERIARSERDQWILIGAEAHVCVLQTALGLLEPAREIFVVADCTGSRRPYNADLALARLRAEGVGVVSREMVAFEWLRRAGTDRFREISREFLK